MPDERPAAAGDVPRSERLIVFLVGAIQFVNILDFMAELATAQSKIQAEAAIAQLKHECERSSREACCDLGEQYRTGRWVPVDAEKAQDLRTRACNLGCDRCCR